MSKSVQSPVDFVKTQIKSDLPLAADTMKMDAQYFSFDENKEDAGNFVQKIKMWVAASTKFLGTETSGKASAEAQKQVSQQTSAHQLDGTLVITASCTHKNACLLAPLILDADKAIISWNELFKGDEFDPDNPNDIVKVAKQKPSEKKTK